MLLDLPPQPAWTEHAACAGMATRDGDPWHPDGSTVVVMAERDRAREVCAGCPVRTECLEYALKLIASVGLRYGIWAGLTVHELRQVARDRGLPTRQVAQHGTSARYVNYKCRCELCRRTNARREHERRIAKTAP